MLLCSHLVTRILAVVKAVLNIFSHQEPGKDMFIRHFHFLRWPDFGVPNSPDALLSFIRKVNDNTPPDGGPVVVHCRSLFPFISFLIDPLLVVISIRLSPPK